LQKEEMNKKAAFEQVHQQLSDDIEYAEKQSSEKSKAKNQAKQDAATAKGDLASAQVLNFLRSLG